MDPLSKLFEGVVKTKGWKVEVPNFGRMELATLFKEMGFKVGVEVGTERGLYAKVLCERNPGVKLYCVDPWTEYDDYHDFTGKMEDNYQETKKRLAPFNCELVRKFSLEAVKDFKDNSLDFVYIDGNHNLKNVVADLVEWTKKVRPGGIVSGHDYYEPAHESDHHVVAAVLAYVRSYFINPLFILGRRRGQTGEVRDGRRSWMFVKGKSL